jgi:hypothetical protein
MATNNDGHLLDSAGNVAVDFVWGNFPLQPNDVRTTNGGSNLDYTKDGHNIAEAGWNGYPLYTPNTQGNTDGGTPPTAYVTVPSVIGVVTATAVDTMQDLELVVTTAGAATNTSKSITAASRTNGSHLLSLTSTAHGFSAGQLVTIASVDATANGSWIVDGSTTANTLVVGTTPTSALSLTGLSGTAVGVTGTIKTQSIAAGTSSVAAGSAITLTPWA